MTGLLLPIAGSFRDEDFRFAGENGHDIGRAFPFPTPSPYNMSKRVLFVCLSLCLIGLLAGWEILQAFINGRFHADVAVLFLPISGGLLMGMPVARTAASGVFILSYLIGAWVLVTPLFTNVDINAALDSRNLSSLSGYPILLVGVLLVVSVLGLLHWLLYSPPFDEHLS